MQEEARKTEIKAAEADEEDKLDAIRRRRDAAEEEVHAVQEPLSGSPRGPISSGFFVPGFSARF